MERKNKIYHVKIYSKFLFELKEFFQSEYSRWIYIYLKLRNNAKIQFGKEEYYPINVSEIAGFFKIDRATVFECLKDIGKFRLLSKRGRNLYRLESEDLLMESYYKANTIEGNVTEENFIPVHNNFFMDMFNSGCGTKEAEVYYYLIDRNRHYAISEPFVEVNVKNNRICADLRMDHRTLKKITNKLLTVGLLIEDQSRGLLTKSPKPVNKPNIIQPLMEIEWNIDKAKPPITETNEAELNKNFLGWYKSLDGLRETEMLKHPQFRVLLGRSREADGIPPTTEQVERQKRIRETGMVEERLDIFV
jgi:hypothetical protein